jgi:glutaredoxin
VAKASGQSYTRGKHFFSEKVRLNRVVVVYCMNFVRSLGMARTNQVGLNRKHTARALATSGLVCALGLMGCVQELGQASYEERLADHLQASGAKMYGAYWCPHCQAQKDLFKGAIDRVPYVECDANGTNAQPELCDEKGIKAYPTWEINGQFSEGVKPLGKLAQLSGFEAPPK